MRQVALSVFIIVFLDGAPVFAKPCEMLDSFADLLRPFYHHTLRSLKKQGEFEYTIGKDTISVTYNHQGRKQTLKFQTSKFTQLAEADKFEATINGIVFSKKHGLHLVDGKRFEIPDGVSLGPVASAMKRMLDRGTAKKFEIDSNPERVGSAAPNGTISINPLYLKKLSEKDILSTLAHEGGHQNLNRRTGLGSMNAVSTAMEYSSGQAKTGLRGYPSGWRGDELESRIIEAYFLKLANAPRRKVNKKLDRSLSFLTKEKEWLSQFKDSKRIKVSRRMGNIEVQVVSDGNKGAEDTAKRILIPISQLPTAKQQEVNDQAFLGNPESFIQDLIQRRLNLLELRESRIRRMRE